MSNWTTKLVTGAGTALVATMAFGCVDDASVSHETTQQAVKNNSANISKSVEASIEFLEESELFAEGWGSMQPAEPACDVSGGANAGGGTDGSSTDGSAGGAGQTSCESMDSGGSGDSENFDAEVTHDGRDYLVEAINNRIFTQGNIESETESSVTYRLRGKVVCDRDDYTYKSGGGGCAVPESGGDSGGTGDCMHEESSKEFDKEGYDSCVNMFDEAKIRLKVQSPNQGDLDIAVMVGPDRHHPLDLELYSDQVAGEVDLAEAKSAASYLTSLGGNEDITNDWPDTFEGRVRGELKATGSNSMAAAVSILQNVKVKGGDYDVSVGRSTPVLRVSADGSSKQIEAETALGVVDAKLPYAPNLTGDEPEVAEVGGSGSGSSDSGSSGSPQSDGEEEPESLVYNVHLGGASAKATFKAGEEKIEVTGIGLGQETSWLDIEGERVFEVDLNKDDGRTFDATIANASGRDAFKFSITPKFDLQMLYKFNRVKDRMDDMAEWMYDEALEVRLDGADPVEGFVGEDGLGVLSGELTLKSNDTTVKASGGQCIVDDTNPVPGTDGSSGDGSGGTMDGEEPVETEPQGPFESLKTESCSM